MHGDRRGKHGRIGLLSLAVRARTLWDARDSQLGGDGRRRDLSGLDLFSPRTADTGDRWPVCVHAIGVRGFRGVPRRLGILDLDLGVAAGDRCRARRVSTQDDRSPRKQPAHGSRAHTRSHLVCGRHEPSGGEGGGHPGHADHLRQDGALRRHRRVWPSLHSCRKPVGVQPEWAVAVCRECGAGAAHHVCLSRARIGNRSCRRRGRPAPHDSTSDAAWHPHRDLSLHSRHDRRPGCRTA